jgi:hypothetical protein
MSEAITEVVAVGQPRRSHRRAGDLSHRRREPFEPRAVARSILTSSDQAAPRSSSVVKGLDRPVAPSRTEGGPLADVGMIGGGERAGELVEIRLDLGGRVVLTIRRG